MKLSRTVTGILFFLFIQISVFAQTQNIYLIKSPENSLVMEVDNKKMNQDGVKVYLKNQNGKDTQKWIITKDVNGLSSIINLASGKAMSILSYDQTKEGNPLILNSPNSSDLQKWTMIISFTTERVTIENYKNSKVLVPYKYSYRNASRILLNRPRSDKKQEWILVPVEINNDVPGYDFSGIYKSEKYGLNMEIRNTGNNIYQAFFTGECTDESFKGSVDRYGKLVLPLKSSNGARLEISNQGNRIYVKIANMSQMSSRGYGKCNGGRIEGYYRKSSGYNNKEYIGRYKLRYGNQNMEIVKSGYDSFKVIFTGNCQAETLPGKLNRGGELEIPLRSGYNEKLFVRRNGSTLNVRVTNKNVMNNVCRGGSLEGDYVKGQAVNEDLTGRFKSRSGRQNLEIVKSGFSGYKAVFTGDCNAKTQEGRIDNRGVLVIPLSGGYNDKLEISRSGNQMKVYVSNREHMKRVCNGYSIEGYYDKGSWNNSGSSSNAGFSGRYQLDMQYVQLIHEGGKRYRARFYGDCELTTKTGTINYKGELEIPFVGENMMQKMIIRKRSNGIDIRNTSNSPMMGLCRGSTLAGFYQKR